MKKYDCVLRKQLEDSYNTPINGVNCITLSHLQLVINAVRRFDERYYPVEEKVQKNLCKEIIAGILFITLLLVTTMANASNEKMGIMVSAIPEPSGPKDPQMVPSRSVIRVTGLEIPKGIPGANGVGE